MKGNIGILTEIFNLCESGGTGSFFIATTENRGCQVVIEEGTMTAISSGRLKGKEALEAFENISIESYSFKEGMIMPLPSRAKVALSSAETKLHIGYILRKSEVSIAKIPQPPSKRERVLLTETLTEASSKVDVKVQQGGKNKVISANSSEKEVVSQRKTRVYRGAVVQ